MAVGFTERERTGIVEALRQAAIRCAILKGMKKTTVDELAAEAGISKGAFYKFYPSKECLFLDMLEQWHSAIEQQVLQVIRENPGIAPRDCAALILKTVWRGMRDKPLTGFYRDDLPEMLRKLPEALWREHYQSNEDFIRGLMARARLQLIVPENVAYAAIRVLIFSLLHAPQIGPGYEQAIDSLIDGACAAMIGSETASAN